MTTCKAGGFSRGIKRGRHEVPFRYNHYLHRDSSWFY